MPSLVVGRSTLDDLVASARAAEEAGFDAIWATEFYDHSATVGIALEVMKYVVLAVWPWMYQKFYVEYGPFVNSALIVFLSFIASMIVLAGAEWAARSREGPQTL